MAEIVNLRRIRKAKARVAEEAQAKESRLRHGLTKAERERQGKEANLKERRLDGQKLD